MKRRRSKPRREFSKIIVCTVGAVTIFVTAFTCVMVWRTGNTDALAYLIPAIFGEAATATGFYYSKAKTENRIKLRRQYAKPLEYGFRGHFVPGHWDGKSFVYQPKDPQGGMFVRSLIPGHYTLERAVNATKRTQNARLQRRFEQELKKRGYMKYFK